MVSAIFLPGQESSAGGRSRSSDVIDRVLALSDDQVDRELAALTTAFAHRHRDLDDTWDLHARTAGAPAGGPCRALRRQAPAHRRLLHAGARRSRAPGCSTRRWRPTPTSRTCRAGSTRFVMTLRAIGEGHRSSVELRTGTIDAADTITLDPGPTVGVLADPRPARFSRAAFTHRLHEPVATATATPRRSPTRTSCSRPLPPTFGNVGPGHGARAAARPAPDPGVDRAHRRPFRAHRVQHLPGRVPAPTPTCRSAS